MSLPSLTMPARTGEASFSKAAWIFALAVQSEVGNDAGLRLDGEEFAPHRVQGANPKVGGGAYAERVLEGAFQCPARYAQLAAEISG